MTLIVGGAESKELTGVVLAVAVGRAESNKAYNDGWAKSRKHNVIL